MNGTQSQTDNKKHGFKITIDIYTLSCIASGKSEKESCSVMSDSAIPQTLQSMEFSRPEYWSWVAFPFSRASSQHRDRTQVSHIADGFFPSWVTMKRDLFLQFKVNYFSDMFLTHSLPSLSGLKISSTVSLSSYLQSFQNFSSYTFYTFISIFPQ